MKLTKDQRHTAYIIMLAEAETNMKWILKNNYGFCWLSRELFGIYPWEGNVGLYGDKELWEDVFPELLSKRTKRGKSDCVWFGLTGKGWEKRIELLKQCIEETYNF